ncbi:MAG: HAD hydrolase-like protein, partial [Planctomycetes bacterium]|nr:HAD hydrolase-like protein [Planctomycetota bacterium]
RSLSLTSTRVYCVCVENPRPALKRMGLRMDNAARAKDLGAIILLDDDFGWNLTRVADVFNLLLDRPDLPLIVPNPDYFYPSRPGYFHPTSGTIGGILSLLLAEKGIAKEILYLGKPYAPMYRLAETFLVEELPTLKRSEIAMLGDTPATDILGANRAGWASILIRTGNLRYGEGRPGCRPRWSFDSLDEFIESLGWQEIPPPSPTRASTRSGAC